jgi:hypothetical protein
LAVNSLNGISVGTGVTLTFPLSIGHIKAVSSYSFFCQHILGR